MMRCTRCGADTQVRDSRSADRTSAQKRHDAKRTVGDRHDYVMRRRHCIDETCGQIFWSVEVAMAASKTTRKLSEPA